MPPVQGADVAGTDRFAPPGKAGQNIAKKRIRVDHIDEVSSVTAYKMTRHVKRATLPTSHIALYAVPDSFESDPLRHRQQATRSVVVLRPSASST
jgi:hypothetical protein